MLPPVSMTGCIRDHFEIVPCCGGARLLLETFSEKKFDLPYADQWTLQYYEEATQLMSVPSKHLVGLISSLWPLYTKALDKEFAKKDAKALQELLFRAITSFKRLDKTAWDSAWDSAVGKRIKITYFDYAQIVLVDQNMVCGPGGWDRVDEEADRPKHAYAYLTLKEVSVQLGVKMKANWAMNHGYGGLTEFVDFVKKPWRKCIVVTHLAGSPFQLLPTDPWALELPGASVIKDAESGVVLPLKEQTQSEEIERGTKRALGWAQLAPMNPKPKRALGR